MSPFFINIIEHSRERLVAACDEEVMELELLSHGIKIKVSSKFYGKDLIEEKELLKEIANCTSANVIGIKIIELLVRHNFIHKDAVIWMDNPGGKQKVGHAILIK